MIGVEELRKNFGGLRALDGISFEAGATTIVGVVGPNGAGKSTLIDVIAGATAPTSGSVSIGGARVDRLPAHEVARRGVARTFQSPRLDAAQTAFENVFAGAHLLARDGFWQRSAFLPSARRAARDLSVACRETLDALGLSAIADVAVRFCSEGERRRVEIARAVARQPDVLLLDEPMSGLDGDESAVVRAALASLERSRRITILLAERDLSTCLGLCDRVVVLHAGRKIAEGTPEACQCDPEVLDAYLGVQWRQ